MNNDLEKVEEAVQKHCGEGKRFETIAEMIMWCKGTAEALGPKAMIGFGAFGIRFCILIPILEEMQKDTEIQMEKTK